MSSIDFQVTYCIENGIEQKLLCSSLDKKLAADDLSDLNNNNVKNSFMPWQCQDIQDDERSLKVEISNTLIGMNSVVCKDYLAKSNKLDSLSTSVPIELKIKSPIDKEFIDKLKNNKKSVKSNFNYNCSLCGYKCQYEAIYKDHLLSHGIENVIKMKDLKTEKSMYKYKCSQCRYTTTHKAMYNKHIIKLGHNTLSCPECKEKFGSIFDLHKHKLTHALGNEFACPLCEYKGQKLIELKKHILKHSEKRLFRCPKCEFASSKVYLLEKHMLSHTETTNEIIKEEMNVNEEMDVKNGRKIRTNIIQDYDRRDLKALYIFEN